MISGFPIASLDVREKRDRLQAESLSHRSLRQTAMASALADETAKRSKHVARFADLANPGKWKHQNIAYGLPRSHNMECFLAPRASFRLALPVDRPYVTTSPEGAFGSRVERVPIDGQLSAIRWILSRRPPAFLSSTGRRFRMSR